MQRSSLYLLQRQTTYTKTQMSDTNRIIGLDGMPPDPKVGMKDLIAKARLGWMQGKKAMAFEAVCTGLELASAGIARLMTDMMEMQKKVLDIRNAALEQAALMADEHGEPDLARAIREKLEEK